MSLQQEPGFKQGAIESCSLSLKLAKSLSNLRIIKQRLLRDRSDLVHAEYKIVTLDLFFIKDNFNFVQAQFLQPLLNNIILYFLFLLVRHLRLGRLSKVFILTSSLMFLLLLFLRPFRDLDFFIFLNPVFDFLYLILSLQFFIFLYVVGHTNAIQVFEDMLINGLLVFFCVTSFYLFLIYSSCDYVSDLIAQLQFAFLLPSIN